MGIMTEQERALVEDHMGLVETVLQKHITPRPDVPGMEHDDLFQVGSLALCLAAQRYDGRCSFSTFAYVVVKNALIDHCRNAMGKRVILVPAEKITEDGEFVNLLESTPDPQNTVNTAEARELFRTLQDAKQRYRGIARKGVQAIEMQMFGYSTKEIAALYGVRTNVVAAWVSRARSLLMREIRDPSFCR